MLGMSEAVPPIQQFQFALAVSEDRFIRCLESTCDLLKVPHVWFIEKSLDVFTKRIAAQIDQAACVETHGVKMIKYKGKDLVGLL